MSRAFPLYLAVPFGLCHGPPPPQDKDKDREMLHMLGRGGRWGPIRDRKQGAAREYVEEHPCPSNLLPKVRTPGNWVSWVTRGFYIPYHICFSKNPGGKKKKQGLLSPILLMSKLRLCEAMSLPQGR